MQVEWKWCGGFNKNNFKHKFYTTYKFWEEEPLPFLKYIFCALLQGLHPNVIFPRDSQVEIPKLGLLLSQNFGHSYISQIKFILIKQG